MIALVKTPVVVMSIALLTSAAALGQEKSCLECHSNLEALRKARTDPALPLERFLVDPQVFPHSYHGKQDCTDCHFDYEQHPHPEDAETPSCVDCHEDAGEQLKQSIHGSLPAGHGGTPPTCTDCHGVHDGFRPADRRSRLHPLTVHKTCGACHPGEDFGSLTTDEMLTRPYTSDVHAHGILKGGLVVSANCVTCHGGHDIRASGDPESRLARSRVDQVCGSCHVTVADDWRQSIHHHEVDGVQLGATCTDCHKPHHIQDADRGFKVATSATCSECHEQRAGTFHKSFHGRVSSFGFGDEVASCADCHGSHTIAPASDPNSFVHPDNLVGTCGSCHEGAHAEFVTFRAHLDPDDPEDNWMVWFTKKSMESLLAFVFIFGGLHVALWGTRSIVGREWRLKAKLKKPGQRHVRRWGTVYVVLHAGLMASVLMLALTGLPLHFSETGWARALMRAYGGPSISAIVHRFGALLLTATFMTYLVHTAWRWLVVKEKGLFRGPNTMLPRVKDVQDLAANVRWFFGLGPKPRFDRWTYWEKFDFWAVFWGMLVIGGSGVILWFPETMTHLVPGWAVNMAEVVHGHEALLAVAFLFTIHLFHGHLRADKFPVDLVFFTGRITEEEFKHERPEEYARAVAEGRLEELYEPEPHRGRRIMGLVIAGVAVAIGVSLTVAMALTLF